MRENMRQHYLSALGVESYFSRWQLPLAPLPFQCEYILPTVNDEDITQLVFDKDVITPQQSSVNVEKIVNLLAHETTSSTSPSCPLHSSVGQQNTLSVSGNKSAVQPFSLSVFRPRETLLIIDLRSPELSSETHHLFSNIMFAVYGDKSPITCEVVRWPAVENEFLPRTMEWACSELQTWLQVEYEQRPFSTVWFMGESTSHYFLTDDVAEAEGSKTRFIFEFSNRQPITLLRFPSLAEILNNPLLKKDIWHQLCNECEPVSE